LSKNVIGVLDASDSVPIAKKRLGAYLITPIPFAPLEPMLNKRRE
jgi:hypothetical protein